MLPQSEQYGRIENTGAPAPMLAAPAWPAVDRRRRSSGPDAVPQGVYTLRALVSLIHRRRFPLAAAFLVLFAAACAVSVLMPKRYEAEAKLMVKRARVDAPVTLERGAAATVSADMTEAEVSAEIELLRSRGLLEEVAVACGLVVEKPTEDRRAAVARAVHAMEKGLTVLPVGKTNLIAVQYRAAEPDLAAQVVNRLVEGYLRKHVAVHRTGNTAVFFKSQAANFEKELNEAQQQFAGFRNKDSVSSLPEQKSSALKRVSDLEAAVEEADSGIRDADNRARLLRQQRASLPSTIETGSRIARSVGLIERLKGQLLELENKRTELLTKYEPGYRLVREVEKQIHDTRAALEREQSPSVVDRTDAPNPLRQSIEADLLRTEASIAGLRARRSSLAHDLAQSRSRLQRLDMLTGEHDDLQRRLKLAEENFLLYQKKGEESRLEDALDQQRILNVSVVEKAVPPAGPAPRHRSVILVIGLLVACFGAISTAFLADYFCQAPGLEAAASPAIRTRPVRAESIPAPEPAQRAKRPVPPPPPLAPRPATNADRAAFVAAGMERYRTPGLGLKAPDAIYAGQDHRAAPALAQAPLPPAPPKPAPSKPAAPKPEPAREVAPRLARVSSMRDRSPVPQSPSASPRVQPSAPAPAAPAPMRSTASAPVAPGGRISTAYRTLTASAAPTMPPAPGTRVATPVAKPAVAPKPQPKPPAAPLKPSGFLGDYAGGSARRLFDE